jgi:hypothetical protein
MNILNVERILYFFTNLIVLGAKLIKIEITIDDDRVGHYGAIIIGEIIQDRLTGKVVGVSDVSAPGFIVNGNSIEDPVIYARVVKKRKK